MSKLGVTVLVAWLIFATLGCVPRSAAGPECGVSECCVREVRCSRVLAQKCTEPLDLEDKKWF